ncbi:zinc carboxypeptidase, partial [bacterium]|nr:zinc carboxypeptidase [bacterium]
MLRNQFYTNCLTLFLLIVLIATPSLVNGIGLDETIMLAVPMEYIDTLVECEIGLNRDILDLVEIDKDTEMLHFLSTDQGLSYLDFLGIPSEQIKSAADLRDDRIDPQYMNYTDVATALGTYQSSYGSIMRRVQLGTTAEGRAIWAAKISDNVSMEESEPAILFTGLHQAREVMSTEIAMDIVDYLCTNYSGNPTVQNWVNTCEIWVVPMVNPDGSNYCWTTDEYWIKNRSDLGGGVYGVDIGHNYSTDWGACFGSSSDPNSNSYRGSHPGSELETQAITSLAQTHRPVIAMSYHSFNEYLLLPYGCYGEFAPESNILTPLASQIASEIRKDNGQYGYDFGHWWELLYANDGNEIDYLYAEVGTLPFAVEVNASSYYPAYSMRNTTVTRNRPGWQEAFDIMVNGNMLKGTIVDSCTGLPIEANFWWAEYPPTSKETPRRSETATGFYAMIGVTGSNTLMIEADGYQPTTITVNLSGQPRTMDIELLPLDEPGLMVWGTYAHDSSGDNDGQLDPGETVELDVGIIAPGPSVTNISGVLTTSDTYLSILDGNATWIDLGPGESAWATDRFEVHASAATPEGHMAVFTVTFTTTETLCDNTSNYTITTQTFIYMCPFWIEPFDVDPDWEITSYPTSGSPPGPYSSWEFGAPLAGPSTAYSGLFLYGTNLAGNYDNNWTLALTSSIIDCTDLANVKLRYAHWIGVEDGYDRARIRLRNDGGSWNTFMDTTTSNLFWQISELDVSSVADDEPMVDIRFDIR